MGFRWSAIHNLFASPDDVAADEWRAKRSADEDNAEKEMRQFIWCLPVEPTKWEQTALEAMELATRVGPWEHGVVPPDCLKLTAAMDLGKYLAHWIVVAWSGGATGHVVDYGRIEVPSSDLGVEPALLMVLRQFRDMTSTGWPLGETHGKARLPDQTWIDSGYMRTWSTPSAARQGAPSCRPTAAEPANSGSNGTTGQRPPARSSKQSARASTSSSCRPSGCGSWRWTRTIGRRGFTGAWPRHWNAPER